MYLITLEVFPITGYCKYFFDFVIILFGKAKNIIILDRNEFLEAEIPSGRNEFLGAELLFFYFLCLPVKILSYQTGDQ